MSGSAERNICALADCLAVLGLFVDLLADWCSPCDSKADNKADGREPWVFSSVSLDASIMFSTRVRSKPP